MDIRVEITSKDTIKPSVPTPTHLRHLKLSLADQLAPWVYSPTVFFYGTPIPNGTNGVVVASNDQIIAGLKESLSETLSLFYPIAGRFTTDEYAIDCDDQGVPYIEARTECTLSTFLSASNRAELVQHFLPISDTIHLGADPSLTLNKPRDNIVTDLPPFAVQLTAFACGSLAIGCFGLHRIVDGSTAGGLFRTWAAVAAGRGGNATLPAPDFSTAAQVFPPRDSGEALPKGIAPLTMWPFEKGECVIRPFVFDTERIDALREKGKSEAVPNPTRIEAVSAFIWKHAMAAANSVSLSKFNAPLSGPSVLIHSVNIRPHTKPPLPMSSAGNLVMHGHTIYEGLREEAELPNLVALVRGAISRAREPDLMKALLGEGGTDVLLQCRKEIGDLVSDRTLNRYRFTHWGRFDMDFGFGKPIWTGVIGGRLSSAFRNVILLLDTMERGLETWIVLNDNEMAVLEENSEFLEFASPNDGAIGFVTKHVK